MSRIMQLITYGLSAITNGFIVDRSSQYARLAAFRRRLENLPCEKVKAEAYERLQANPEFEVEENTANLAPPQDLSPALIELFVVYQSIYYAKTEVQIDLAQFTLLRPDGEYRIIGTMACGEILVAPTIDTIYIRTDGSIEDVYPSIFHLILMLDVEISSIYGPLG